MTAASPVVAFDLDAAWDLHPRVEIRPERFGALLYSFDTRRLSFLRSPELLAVCQALVDAPSARAACAVVGIPDDQLPSYRAALARLAETDMITSRGVQGVPPSPEAARTAPGRPLAALSSSPDAPHPCDPPPCQETPAALNRHWPPASTWD